MSHCTKKITYHYQVVFIYLYMHMQITQGDTTYKQKEE